MRKRKKKEKLTWEQIQAKIKGQKNKQEEKQIVNDHVSFPLKIGNSMTTTNYKH